MQQPQLPATQIPARPALTSQAGRAAFVMFTALVAGFMVAYSTPLVNLVAIYNGLTVYMAEVAMQELALRTNNIHQGYMFEAMEADRLRQHVYKVVDGWVVTWMNANGEQNKHDIEAVQRNAFGTILRIVYIEVKSSVLSYVKDVAKRPFQKLSGSFHLSQPQQKKLETPPAQHRKINGVTTEYELHVLFFATILETTPNFTIFVSVTTPAYWLNPVRTYPKLRKRIVFQTDQLDLDNNGGLTSSSAVRIEHVNHLFNKIHGPQYMLPQLAQIITG